MIYVYSATSGNKLYGDIIKVSWLRKLLCMRPIQALVQGTNLKGTIVHKAWYYPYEIHNVAAKAPS